MKLADVRSHQLEKSLETRPSHIDQLLGLSRRLGVPEVAVELTLNPEAAHLPPGRPIAKVGLNLWRYMIGKLKYIPPAPKGCMFMTSWEDVSFVERTLSWLRDELDSTDMPVGIREAELDNLKKAVLETGQTGCGHIEPAGIRNVNDVTIPGIEHFFDWLETTHGSPNKRETLSLTAVKGTNHGWPSYVSGMDSINDIDFLAHAWLSNVLAVTDGSISRADVYIREHICDPKEPLSSLMFFRSGPNAKKIPFFSLHPEGVQEMGKAVGLSGRERQVFAVPTWVNLFLRPAATLLKDWIRRDVSFFHGPAQDTMKFLKDRPHLSWFSEDISGYDKSVTRRMQKDLLSKGYKRFMTDDEATCYDELQDMSVLAPSLTSTDEAFLYERSGITVSGSIFTTNDGTILNVCRIAFCISSALKISIPEVWASKGDLWDVLVLGDDCVIGLRDKSASVLDAYLLASRSLTFKTDLFEGAVFLMTSYDLRRDNYYGVISRAVSKTFFRERETRSETVDLLGLFSRWDRCRTHPLFAEAWKRAILDHPVSQRVGLSTIDNLEQLVTSPAFKLRMQSELKDPLKRGDLSNFLTGAGHGDFEDGLAQWSDYIAFYGGNLSEQLRHSATPYLDKRSQIKRFHAQKSLWSSFFSKRIMGLVIDPDEFVNKL